ncbi:tRNA glutamyl-Q(34) synthetase GluQRS [Pontixanthobacter aestiaquae]|uniref:tRNA glutamyl-Q(34) synthetase GluQRS n=1 Tax=Pontixanthobacter aestiaquae TaxID=1509367 RepID=A0A844Z7N7_9SPHN|nr:tRNA glutamyl-Q(34) synthetase GluQRS [Pontixanthobacter aestiaquae]MDN3647105.1 tRNA glutamyl-Q(34) synthetase GluQRS [Pontixanthobacter aestiaquae]MXO81919.1 tRNA glutamyl-Q(34) synthetase GluQRS [Pontixanthobacter aestiaquae]
MIVTRFAPSPNGPLHLGHALSAITAHDLAKDAGGQFLLRIEDIDGARSRPELAESFRADLEWLGLEWEEVSAQSTRLAGYEAAAERLKSAGLLYPCQCTRADIKAAATKFGPEGPIYPGTCKGKDVDLSQPVAWRLDIGRAQAAVGPLDWFDALAGPQVAVPERLGDVLIMRKDAPASYHLAVTIDDAADGVTLVTRGQDLFAATHIHRLLQALLDLPVPRWHHHPLLLDEIGKKLAKRRGSASLADLREAAVDGAKIASDIRLGRFPIGMSLRKG